MFSILDDHINLHFTVHWTLKFQALSPTEITTTIKKKTEDEESLNNLGVTLHLHPPHS
jgi:hypothetical protein